MILIKRTEDLANIGDIRHRAILADTLKNLESEVIEYDLGSWEPDDNGYSIYIENAKDDITKLPHLNESEQGLLCYGSITKDTPHVGWCWEQVRYYFDADLYEICIIMNNEFGIGYYIPNDEFIDGRLKSALEIMMCRGDVEIIYERSENG